MPIPDGDIRAFWNGGGVAIGGWLNVPNPFVTEVMAAAGWDTLTIDLQHGLIDYDTAVGMLQAMRGTGVVPFARLAWMEPGIIMKMLDAGCMGLIAPMISSGADAEAFVAACRYPPRGYRSIGPTRASLIYGADYIQQADARVTCIALIETAEAIENIEEIARTPGLDALLIGPSDLSRSLVGASSPQFTDPTVSAAIDKVIDAAKRTGRVTGVYALEEADTLAMARKGVQWLPMTADSRILLLAAQGIVGRIRTVIE